VAASRPARAPRKPGSVAPATASYQMGIVRSQSEIVHNVPTTNSSIIESGKLTAT
jgi:hypothetical protein